MLSIKWITGVDYYLKKKRRRRPGDADEPELGDDPDSAHDPGYYFDLAAGPGEWWGRGAELLGLVGLVKPEDLRALCQGFGPDGKPLIQNAGATDHQQAWDLTFSVPKSLSVLWTQVDQETRLKISELIRQATIAALSYLTNVALLTRRGKGGKITERALPIVAIVPDFISRELDPQLHKHCVLLNVAGRADGTFGTILSRPFFMHKLSAGALFQAELAHLLLRELGLKLEQDTHGFRVAGVPEKLNDHYSTRSKQIREKLRSKGFHSAKAAAVATLDTRKRKPEIPPSQSDLLELWRHINAEFGFTEAKAQRLLGRASAPQHPPVLKGHIAQAMHELLETESYFSEQQLIRQVARKVVAEGVAATEIIDQVRSFLLHEPDLVFLQSRKQEPLFTTREMLVLESEMLAAINAGRNDTSHVVKKPIVHRALDQHLPLHADLTEDERARNEEQRKAAYKLTATPGQVQVLEGLAGTGKGYAAMVAAHIFSKAGFRVIGMTPSAVAAAILQASTGKESDTIAMRLVQLNGRKNFAYHHKQQFKRLFQGQRTYAYRGSQLRLTAKTVVILDEAGMVGTRDMAKIVRHVRKAGAKLVLIGHRQQLPPIAAGGPFAAIANRTGKAELNHVVRQKLEPHDPYPNWHRDAGKLIAEGHVAQAIKLFKERGRFSVLNDRAQALLAIVRDWSVEGMANPLDHIVLAGTRAEVAELNNMCQSARLNAGILGPKYIVVGDYQIRMGDVVVFRKNSRLYQVKNGDRGVVLGFNRLAGTLAVRLHQTGKTVFIPYRSYTDIQLAYAVTTHVAQGSTVPSVYVLLGGTMQDRHLSYVQATRACESTRLYVDKYHAGPGLKQLLGQMAKERPKLLAHDLISAKTPSPNFESPLSNKQPVPHAGKASEKHGTAKPKGAAAQKPTPDAATKRPQSATAHNSQSVSPSKRNEVQAHRPTAPPLRNAADQSRNATPIQRTPPGQPGKQAAAIPKRAAVSAPQPNPTVEQRKAVPLSQQIPVQNRAPTKRADQAAADQARDPLSIKTPDKPLALGISTDHRAAKLSTTPAELSSQASQRAVETDRNATRQLKSVTPAPAGHAGDEYATTSKHTAIPVPEAKPTVPPRDLLDVSHVQVVGSMDVELACAALKQYGRIPGGIVAEGAATCEMPIVSLAIDPSRPTHLVINGSLQFDTGLSPEEVALLWHAVLEEGHATSHFGALSQYEATGISNDTLVAVSMMQADNALGGIVYGYDGQFCLGNPSVASYRNPFLEELKQTILPEVIDRLCTNYVDQLQPRIFLRVTDVHFVKNSPDILRVRSSKLTAVLTAINENGIPVVARFGPLPPTRFPTIHEASQHFVEHFREYARAAPDLARTIAYAEVVLLLRLAKSGKASLVGQDHVLALVAKRQQIPLPRFNYTLRSAEFVAVVADAARRLSGTHSTALEDLASAIVGFHYARQAGDFETFLTCKQKALRYIAQLKARVGSGDRQRRPLLPLLALAERMETLSHDTVMDSCVSAAFSSRSEQEKARYLRDALSHFNASALVTKDSLTRCNQLKLMSYLDATFDPVPGLAQVRQDDPCSLLPYTMLKTINARRPHLKDADASLDRTRTKIQQRKRQLRFAKLAKQDVEFWNTIEAELSTAGTLWLLDEIQRLEIAVSDYLSEVRQHGTDRLVIVLSQLVARRLQPLPASSFSSRLVHRNSPFFGCRKLLDYETRNSLLMLLDATKTEMGWIDPPFLYRQKGRFHKLRSMLRLTDPEGWLKQILWDCFMDLGSESNESVILPVLLAYEMKVRAVSVKQLHRVMRRHRTDNPQAALFFFDLEVSEKALRKEKRK